MNKEKIIENCRTDPKGEKSEKGFTVSFTKADGKANISSGIASQVKRAIQHSDINVEQIQVYYEGTEDYSLQSPEQYSGGRVVGFKGTVPIESLKIQSNPRSNRSYANIISPQTEVNFDAD